MSNSTILLFSKNFQKFGNPVELWVCLIKRLSKKGYCNKRHRKNTILKKAIPFSKIVKNAISFSKIVKNVLNKFNPKN